MGIVVALDVHRKQVTYKALDRETGEVKRGRIAPAARADVREWLARFAGCEAEFVLEGTTGWRFVVEEIEQPAHVPRRSRRAGPARKRSFCADVKTQLSRGSVNFDSLRTARKGAEMAVDVKSEKLFELVDQEAQVEKLATGFTFTEGPIWNKAGGYLLFSDMPGDIRRRWSEDDGVTEVANPSNKGNGMTYDAEGRLLVCEHVTSSLVRMDPDGTGSGREVLASHYDGKELNSPNDVIVADDGSIYFSDPWYGRMPVFGLERQRALGFQGVYRIAPGGGDPQLLVDDFEQPNGLCFTPDESLLYVNDTPRAHIRVFDRQPDGTIANGRMFFENIGSGVIEEGIPDGMKCDERGNIYVTGPGGVWVITPEAELLGVIEVPENVGNLNWGGDDWSDLYMPSTTSLYRISLKVSGNRLSYMT